MKWISGVLTGRRRLLLAAAICLSTAALLVIGYRAVSEWQRAAALVASRRASSAAELLVSALAHDMRGAHTSVLHAAEREGLNGAPPVDLLHPIAGAFTRFPYVDAFFSISDDSEEGVVFYSRVDRRPAWLSSVATRAPYPVTTGSDRRVGQQLRARLAADSQQGRRFSAFTLPVNGTDYQVAAVIGYSDTTHEHAASVLGYMVDLAWTREHYFAELTAQVGAIEGSDHSVRFALVDDHGVHVVGSPDTVDDSAPIATRVFPVAFFDPAAVAVDPPPDLNLTWWTAIATARDDPTLAAAETGARRTLALAALMTATLALGLIASLQAARASAGLAVMRADFVSAVTHELKTPLANLRVINETLASGRTTPEMVREYADMGIGETTRLTRLVDNLLAYARVTDVADVYAFEPVALHSAVQRSLQQFRAVLARQAFTVAVQIPDDLHKVRADPHALELLLNNLIDNAIRYSKQDCALTIAAHGEPGVVVIEVCDRGVGIPAHELDRVTRKFVRGREVASGGSGLGLAIVDRIVSDHGGTWHIQSEAGRGTTVSVTMPAAD